MLGYIWSAMIIISVISSFVTGRTQEVCLALGEGANEGINLCISIAGVMAFWTGIMKIAEESSLVHLVAKCFSPLICTLFPEAKKDASLGGAIAMNMTANFFGMGNAATPLGLEAMKRLSRYSTQGRASDSMCMLAVVNCASVQLIPSTLIAIRSAAGSANPSEITVPIWIVSVATFAAGVAICRFLGRTK